MNNPSLVCIKYPALALWVLMLSLIPSAGPALIVKNSDQDVVLTADLNQASGEVACNIDLARQSSSDFTIRLKWRTWNDGDDFRYDLLLQASESGAFVAPEDGYVGLLPEGTKIEATSHFHSCGTNGGQMVWYYSDDDAANAISHWGVPGHQDVSTTGYIGVRVQDENGGFDQFGWIKVTVAWEHDPKLYEPRLTATVHEWAVDVSPRRPINAGQGPDYDDWASYRFGDEVAREDTAPTADPDGDGLVNLAEYYFLRNPQGANNTPVLNVTVNGEGQAVLDYKRRINDPDATVVVEASMDLQTWIRAEPGDFEELVYYRVGDGETLRATYIVEGGDALFFRLAVVAIP
jgi:hypothetical protein